MGRGRVAAPLLGGAGGGFTCIKRLIWGITAKSFLAMSLLAIALMQLLCYTDSCYGGAR